MPTITCQQTRQLISEALDESAAGVASPLHTDAEQHLADCDDCVRYRVDVSLLDARLGRPVAIAEDHATELPAGYHERIIAALRADDGGSKIVGFPKWIAPAMGIAAAVAVVFLALRGGDTPNREGGDIADVTPGPAVEEAPGLPGGLDISFDVASLTAAAERRVTSAFTKEADAMAADVGKVRDFFASRVGAVGRIGL